MNDVPSEFESPEKCLVTGDLATESPVHLCHVFHERHWSNHPLVSSLRKSFSVSKLTTVDPTSYRVLNGHGA